jgi:hypothetical protein
MVARTRGSCHSVRPMETDANASRHTSLERGHLFAIHDVGGFKLVERSPADRVDTEIDELLLDLGRVYDRVHLGVCGYSITSSAATRRASKGPPT